jgi:hypothetical protein
VRTLIPIGALLLSGCGKGAPPPPVLQDTSGPGQSSAVCEEETSAEQATVGDQPDVRISEFMWWDQGPYDWIELVNAGGATADLTGWVLNDGLVSDDDTERFLFTSGFVLEPGAFHVFHRHGSSEENTTYDFGLAHRDTIHLYDGTGTLVDSYAWDLLLEDQILGRPDEGQGELTHLPCSTPGRINIDPIGQADCEASEACATLGMCTLWDGRCWKQVEDWIDCGAPVVEGGEDVCGAHGHCSIDEQGLCMAQSLADCESGYGVNCSSCDWQCEVGNGYCLIESDSCSDND